MDLFAPCDFYGRPAWAAFLSLESDCLNCVRFDAEPVCPEFARRMRQLIPPGEALALLGWQTRERAEAILSTRVPTTCAGKCAGAGGERP